MLEAAIIDLSPLATNARKNVEAAISDFRKNVDGLRVEAAVVDVRLADVEFDSKTLRLIAEADGTVRVVVTALP
jgi:copper chaperone CopZ